MCNNEISEIKKTLQLNFPYKQDDFGKMFRSKMGVLLLKSISLPITEEHLQFLTVIELIHNASLLHDDIIDNQHIRRGKASLFDPKTALLYGNMLTVKGYELLLKIGSIELMSLINKTINDMCKGELLQQTQLYKIPTMEEYIKKTTLKTARLFQAVYKGINILSGGIIDNKFDSFFENFGIGYQIKNDLDNILKDKSDIKNGVYTAPVIYSGSTEITNDSLEKTLSLIDNYRGEGVNVLSGMNDNIYNEELIRIVECLKN